MISTEAVEGEMLANWLRSKGYTFTHIVNEGGLPYAILGRVAQKWALQGKSPGVPDYMIILKRGSLLFIELKRKRKILKNGSLGASPSTISDEQKEWIQALGAVDNVEALIAYGFDHAKEIIREQEEI